MPLFEVDAERPVLVQPPQPAGAFGTDAQRVVDGNLEGLLGEQIFPVAHAATATDPHLLALDAAGLPVVIEVVAELSPDTLTRALNHAGRAGRLTRSELAAQYAGGSARFHQDVAAFYDNIPLTRSQSTSRSTGARLVVICSSADLDVRDALDFLRQPGLPVTLLRLGVVHGQDGRRFVDVSPLALDPAPVAAGAIEPGPESEFADGVAVGRALTGKMPVVTVRPAPEVVTPLPTRASRRRAAAEPVPTDAAVRSADAPVPAPAPDGWADRLPAGHGDDTRVPRTSAPTRQSVRTRASVLARAEEPYVPVQPAPEPLGPDDDPDLVALAGRLGTPSRLVWSRPRRGQRFEAVLQSNGFIELPDGGRFRHPDLAAVAASGTSTADGWSVWRLGDDGPTLTDAFRQHCA